MLNSIYLALPETARNAVIHQVAFVLKKPRRKIRNVIVAASGINFGVKTPVTVKFNVAVAVYGFKAVVGIFIIERAAQPVLCTENQGFIHYFVAQFHGAAAIIA